MLGYRVHVLRNILSKPMVLFSTSTTQSENKTSTLIQRLSDEFSEAKPIILKLEKCAEMNTNFNEWKSRIDIFKANNFSNSESFQMISRYPSVLEIPLSKLKATLQQWQLGELGSGRVRMVLINQPILLEVEDCVIRSRMPQLRVEFGSSASLSLLLINSPNVMYDNWKGVLAKIFYLLKERKFKAGDIVQCPALSNSLDFIKFRFDLLEKCGVYKQNKLPIHKINKYDRSGHVNPSLKYILTTNIREFLKMSKISQEEYEVYRDMFMEDEGDEIDSDTED